MAASKSSTKPTIPEDVTEFIKELAQTIEQQKPEVQKDLFYLYDRVFNELTSKYYADGKSWPTYEELEPLNLFSDIKYVRGDGEKIFKALYNEIRIRHIYAKHQAEITVQLANESYENYHTLFSLLLKYRKYEEQIKLPAQWVWNIIDEYIYQFQNFCKYRSQPKFKKDEEVEILKAQGNDIWNAVSVMRQLHNLIDSSKIRNKFVDSKEVNLYDLINCIGYFSMIGLLRINVLFGDFYSGLQAVSCLDLFDKAVLKTRITASIVTLFYYTAFSYVMLRRYYDAVKCLQIILNHILKTKQPYSKSYQADNVSKLTDQMYALLAIAVSLCSCRLDESVHLALREKHSKEITQMQRGEESVYEDLFRFAQPKSVTPYSSLEYGKHVKKNTDRTSNFNSVFKKEIYQSQHQLPAIRTFLRLYTSITLEKLGNFIDCSDVNLVREYLLRLKHKTIQLQFSKTHRTFHLPLTHDFQSSMTDVDYHIIDGMVHIADSTHNRHYADCFIKYTEALNEILG